MNLLQVWEGWRNSIIPPTQLKEKIEQTYHLRMEICKECEEFSENKREITTVYRQDEHCTNCGCPTGKKLRCLSCECPLKKWMKVMSDEEETSLKKE